jgi:beta-glucanase (GH16 family)
MAADAEGDHVKRRVIGGFVTVALAGGLAAVGQTAGGATVTGPAGVTASGTASAYQLVWHDNFDGSKLGPQWQVRPTAASRPCTTVTRSMGTVSGGVANISVKQNKGKPKSKACPKGWFYNAQFTTEDSKQFLYGKFQARIKVQKQQGLHGGYFLFYSPGAYPGVDPNDLPGSLGSEIDAVEYFGDNDVQGTYKGAIQNSVFYPRKKADGSIEQVKVGGRVNTKKITGKTKKPSAAYHVYEVEWTPSAYIFRMDGKETSRITRGISHRPQFLYLSMLTSAWELPDMDVKTLPATMKVDWVRVYQK